MVKAKFCEAMKFEDIDYSKYNFKKMSKEEFAAVPPEIKRSCYDCKFCKPVLSWWCMNKEAIKLRGTSIPGVIKCPYWEKKASIPLLDWLNWPY